MKPPTLPLQSARLLDHLREQIRYRHYSIYTEKVYLYWVRFFVWWHLLMHPGLSVQSGCELFGVLQNYTAKPGATTLRWMIPDTANPVQLPLILSSANY